MTSFFPGHATQTDLSGPALSRLNSKVMSLETATVIDYGKHPLTLSRVKTHIREKYPEYGDDTYKDYNASIVLHDDRAH